MPRYRVTLRRTSVEIVKADNPYQAAIVASDLFGEGVEVERVASAVGRPVGTSTASRGTAKKSKKAKKVVKKRRPMSPEARARLAQNLVKARAARARNLKAEKKKSTKRATKKTARKKTAAKKMAGRKTAAKKAAKGR